MEIVRKKQEFRVIPSYYQEHTHKSDAMIKLQESIKESREAQVTRWYVEVFPLAAVYVRKRGGDLEAARDIFQEALIVYYEKVIVGDFEPQVSEAAYLMGIVKKRWLKQQSTERDMKSLDDLELSEERNPQTRTDKLFGFLKQSGEKCMDLLQSFYYEKLSMKEISGRFGYSSERSATVQKFKCLEKVREEVKQKSLAYEDFLD